MILAMAIGSENLDKLRDLLTPVFVSEVISSGGGDEESSSLGC